MKKRFAIIGVGGFVAQRHVAAISAINGDLIAALDPHDSVGYLDTYFPECRFFTEFERFDRFLSDTGVDYVAVCSPNYLHDAHCRFALRVGADAICEKPVVLTTRNLCKLRECERRYGHRVWCILQSRLHPEFARMKKEIDPDLALHDVSIKYAAPRGRWYPFTWKGDLNKSGGIETNIGVHLFDLCAALFGHLISIEGVSLFSKMTVSSGLLYLSFAAVDWRLSINRCDSPQRLFVVDGHAYDFTSGFEALHTESYNRILRGEGFGLVDAREGVSICEKLRVTHMVKTFPDYFKAENL